jgi:hypothetical protein
MPPPKTKEQATSSHTFFHGRRHGQGIWTRPITEMIDYSVLREPYSLLKGNDDALNIHYAGIALWRLRILYIDSGLKYSFLSRAAGYIEEHYTTIEVPDPADQFFQTDSLLHL